MFAIRPVVCSAIPPQKRPNGSQVVHITSSAVFCCAAWNASVDYSLATRKVSVKRVDFDKTEESSV